MRIDMVPGPSDDSLRRAGLMRYAETENTNVPQEQVEQLRALILEKTGKNPDDRLTAEDIEKVRPQLSEAGYQQLRKYIGFPIKYAYAIIGSEEWQNEIPNQLKVAYLMARVVGKNITETFTDADLEKLAKHYNWGQGTVNFWKNFTGQSFYAGTGAMASGILDTLANSIFGLPTVPGQSGILNPFKQIQDMMNFVGDPGTWLAIAGLVIGGGLVVYGGMRYLRGGQ